MKCCGPSCGNLDASYISEIQHGGGGCEAGQGADFTCGISFSNPTSVRRGLRTGARRELFSQTLFGPSPVTAQVCSRNTPGPRMMEVSQRSIFGTRVGAMGYTRRKVLAGLGLAGLGAAMSP